MLAKFAVRHVTNFFRVHLLLVLLFLGLWFRHCLALGDPSYEAGLDGQLVPGFAHGFGCEVFAHARYLEEHAARLDNGHPVIRCALAGAHTGFGGLGAHRLVGEDTDPHLATALDMACDGTTGGLDLAAVDPGCFKSLQPVLPEGHAVTAGGLAGP